MNRRSLILFAAGALSGAVLACGVAVAAIPSTTDGTTTLCVKTTGATRVIDYQAGKRCTSGEKRVTLKPGVSDRGTWSSSATYAAGDIVRLNGATFLARTTSKGKSPATTASAWGKIASAPVAGPKGPAGPQGPAGPVEMLTAGPVTGPLATSATKVIEAALPAGTFAVDVRVGVATSSGSAALNGSCTLDVVTPDQNVGSTDGASFVAPPAATAGTLGNFTWVPLRAVVTLTAPGGGVRVSCLRSTSSGVSSYKVDLQAARITSVSQAGVIAPVG